METGSSLKHYIITEKILESMKLLSETDKTIVQISEELFSRYRVILLRFSANRLVLHRFITEKIIRRDNKKANVHFEHIRFSD